MFRLADTSKYCVYTVFHRRVELPRLRIFGVPGTTLTLATTQPRPLGASTKLPLVSVVNIVLLAIRTLLSTGPAAKT